MRESNYPPMDPMMEIHIRTNAARLARSFSLQQLEWLAGNDEAHLVEPIQQGARQLASDQGLCKEAPLHGIGIKPVYRLMNLMGFRIEYQRICDDDKTMFIDHMVFVHDVIGQVAHVFNRVKKTLDGGNK